MGESVLNRQLKRLGLSKTNFPKSIELWTDFLSRVSKAYEDNIQDRYLMERSINLASKEMNERAQALERLEQKWKTLLDALPDTIITINSDGTITYLNKSFGTLQTEGAVSKNIYSFFESQSIGAISNELKLSLANNTFFSREVTLTTLYGEQQHFLLRSLTITDPTVKVSSVSVIIATDITENKQLAQQLDTERAMAVNSAKMGTLGEMAGGIAHEINTPITVIKMSAENMIQVVNEATIDRPTVIGLAQDIKETTERVVQIVNGLRAFAREGSNDPCQPTNIKKLIEDTMLLCKHKLAETKVPATISFAHIDTLTIDCRAAQISQIIMNLVNNSADAISQLSEKWIRITSQTDNNYIQIIIADSGKGIPVDIAKKIMEPFFTTKPIGKGTGLGLSISKGLAESHNGTLSVCSKAANTTFILRLPLKQPL